jgi:AcrR family transcriptional regulator
MARPKQISDAQLLAMAHKVFLKEGPNAPVSLVAKRLGVTAAALFHRVGSKEKLLEMAMVPEEPPALERFRTGFQPDRPADVQLVEELFGLVKYITAVIPAGFCMKTGGVELSPQNSGIRNSPLALRQALAGWLSQAQAQGKARPGDPEIMAETLVGTLEARYTLAYLLRKKYSRDESRAFVEGLVKDVLRTR